MKERLVGNDGYLCVGEIGSPLTGNGTSDLDTLVGGGVGAGKGIYEIAAMGASSVFPAGFKAGDFFYDDGTLVPVAGDEVIFLPIDPDTTMKAWEVAFSRGKIDVTTLTDTVKTYRMGMADASGSLTAVNSLNNDIISSRFYEAATTSGATKSIKRINGNPIYFVGAIQGEEVSGGKLAFLVGRVGLESYKEGIAGESAQEFSSNFAPAEGSKLQKIIVEVA